MLDYLECLIHIRTTCLTQVLQKIHYDGDQIGILIQPSLEVCGLRLEIFLLLALGLQLLLQQDQAYQ